MSLVEVAAKGIEVGPPEWIEVHLHLLNARRALLRMMQEEDRRAAK